MQCGAEACVSRRDLQEGEEEENVLTKEEDWVVRL